MWLLCSGSEPWEWGGCARKTPRGWAEGEFVPGHGEPSVSQQGSRPWAGGDDAQALLEAGEGRGGVLGCAQAGEKPGAKESVARLEARGRPRAGEEGRGTQEAVQGPELHGVGAGERGLRARLCVTRAGRGSLCLRSEEVGCQEDDFGRGPLGGGGVQEKSQGAVVQMWALLAAGMARQREGKGRAEPREG